VVRQKTPHYRKGPVIEATFDSGVLTLNGGFNLLNDRIKEKTRHASQDRREVTIWRSHGSGQSDTTRV